MASIKDLEYALKALDFNDVTPYEYNSDLTNDYTLEYRKDFKDFSSLVSIDDNNIKITVVKGSRIVSNVIKVKVFGTVAVYPLYWLSVTLNKLTKEVN